MHLGIVSTSLGKVPATIVIEDKIASGKIYMADSRHNLLGLDFIKSLGLLDLSLNSVCNAVSRSPAQNAIMKLTDDTKRFPFFTNDLGRCTQAEATLARVIFLNVSFSERKARVCYSNYRVVDCTFFFFFLVHPPGGEEQKGTGLFLLASDWQWEKEVKFQSLSSITHRRGKSSQRWLVQKVYFKWTCKETGIFWEMQAWRFLSRNSLLWSSWEMSNSLKKWTRGCQFVC